MCIPATRPSGPLGVGRYHAPWCCPWFFGWGARDWQNLAVEVVVPGSESHFGLTEDERKEPMLPTTFGRKMLDEVSHRVECGLPHNSVKHLTSVLSSYRWWQSQPQWSSPCLHHWCAERNMLTELNIVLPCITFDSCWIMYILSTTPCSFWSGLSFHYEAYLSFHLSQPRYNHIKK